jgi:hypothetical protein
LFLIGYCLKKSSPLKLLGKMESKLAGSIYVRSKPGIDGPIDAYCQVWFHLAKLFQRRRLKYEKVNRRTPSDGNISHELKNDEKSAISPRRVITFT